jgi:hypothetical protein
MRMVGRACLTAGVLAFLAGAALAQTLTGTIEGTVKDEQGGGLPGATITLTGKTGSKAIGTERSGSYRFIAVEPGTYQVSAALSGFKSLRRDGVMVTIGKNVVLDFLLKIAGVSETIEVVAEAPIVDVTSTEASNSVSQDLLFNIPINRNTGTDVMNYTPGINSDAAFGGDAATGNALLIDGVDTRDPDGGSAWVFYNYNLIEQVQVGGLGAPAEYGAFTGAVVNTITKSGGNQFAGLFDGVYSRKSLSSDNVSDAVKALNPSLADAAKTLKYLDLTAQLSGPLIKDKLFFLVSAQRYRLNNDPSGPTTLSTELDPRLNLKITWLPNSKDSVTGTLQYDAYNITGRSCFFCVGGAAVTTDDLTVLEDAPEFVWGANWHHVVGSSTAFEVKYTGWNGYFDLDPKVNAPAHYDGATGLNSVSNGAFYRADRSRHQLNASLTHYADAFGRHDLKFGVEIERSKVHSRYGLVDNITYYDYAGQPYLAYSYGYDISASNQREALFAQDAWKVGSRLTIDPGVRLDLIRGYDQKSAKKAYDVHTLAPRIGFALDLTGDEKTVLKAHYGRYYEGAFIAPFSLALSGQQDRVTYDMSSGTPVEIDRQPQSTSYRVDPNIKHPRVDQFIVAIERALTPDFRLAVTGIWRDNKNFTGSVIPGSLWTPTTVQNGLTGQPLTVYNWANQGETGSKLITNPDGFPYQDTAGNLIGRAKAKRRYKGLMTVLSKRLSNRWQAQVSYVLSKTDGTVDNNDSSIFGLSQYSFETPTLALVNSEGPLTFDRRHEVKVLATYQVPKIDLNLNAYYRFLSGITYAAFERFGEKRIHFGNSSGRTPLIEPLGAHRTDSLSTLDLRLEKVFRLADRRDQFGIYSDITNVFNSGKATSVFRRFPSSAVTISPEDSAQVPLGAPAALLDPRVITFGARWSF